MTDDYRCWSTQNFKRTRHYEKKNKQIWIKMKWNCENRKYKLIKSKASADGLNTRVITAEEWVSELKKKSVETLHNKEK